MSRFRAEVELRFVIDVTRPLPDDERELFLKAVELAKQLRTLHSNFPLATTDLLLLEGHLKDA